jgi:hypothetical protein
MPRGLGFATATTSAAFVPQREQRNCSAGGQLRGNEAELMAGRALNQPRKFKLEPCATTLAAHFVHVLYCDRTQLLFVDFYPAGGCASR